MRYENEDGCNKSDVGGSSESFLKAPRVTRQVYAETSIIPVTYFIASWANSGSPVPRLATSLFSLRLALPPTSLPPLPLFPPPQPRLRLARTIFSPSLGSLTFLFLIDTSSVLYELSLSPARLLPSRGVYDFARQKYPPRYSRLNVFRVVRPRDIDLIRGRFRRGRPE